ncbi:hydroxyethylthiazole kinase [Oikeobacillus pervagus]|uniref:Hydroxyethylthiazole kinase n=1 Tax=Oikeobacillus pervagus TaxID=1325931 RepID=A0AAJ1SX38_9BACI|nr:hydroxyethylthiazole kinase [Oikeobacillus pervagus]MDQ0214388.1 hydroxyethylthiazole kinase [Oikeobacillus pervagus]
MKDEILRLFSSIQSKHPLVHHITNNVTINDCANVTLAIGGSPVMADAKQEAANMTKLAQSLVLNFGTLGEPSFESMILSGKMANHIEIPVIFDPVGVGATEYRTKRAQELLDQVEVSVVRGNQSEIAALIGEEGSTRGVDAGDIQIDPAKLAIHASQKLGAIIAVTGATDIITDGERMVEIHNGHPMMTKVTGTGCMSTSLIGSFSGCTKHLFAAAVAGTSVMSIAGERAYRFLQKPVGTATFRMKIIDEISLMTGDIWREEVKIIENKCS